MNLGKERKTKTIKVAFYSHLSKLRTESVYYFYNTGTQTHTRRVNKVNDLIIVISENGK